MAKNVRWQDEYWLLLMQLYLKKPEGVKPLYSRGLVDLSLELHIPPQFLYKQMFKLRSLDTPRMEKLWERYGNNPNRLAKGVKKLRQMKGMGNADEFYDGVETNESFELDFKPLKEDTRLTPVKLIIILDLYFRLTPKTMVKETLEIQSLAKMLKIPEELVVEVMEAYQICDPCLKWMEVLDSPLIDPCHEIWQRYGNENPEKLATFALQLKEYYK